MAAILEKVSSPHDPMAVWGFKNPVNAREVKAAVNTLANSLAGAGHHFIIMTGTHGVCSPAGLIGTQEIKFAEQDLTGLKDVKTKDGHPISIQIWPINSRVTKARTLDEVTELAAFLNHSLGEIHKTVRERRTEAKTLVLLAYCCSAGR